MINIVWQSYHPETPTRGYWDMAMLEGLFDRSMWNPVQANELQHVAGFAELPEDADGAIVVLPARYHAEDISKLNADIEKLKWVLLILVGDEESVFPVEQVKHPNIKTWVMTPKESIHRDKVTRVIPNGYTPDAVKMLPNYQNEYLQKPLDYFFSGQVTHSRRIECVAALKTLSPSIVGRLNETAGFTQGLSHEDYYKSMAEAKFVPAPSGAVMPDSFRAYEALEAGAIPLVDGRSPNPDYPTGFWTFLFGKEPPFPVVDQWENVNGILTDELAKWPRNANAVYAWWQNYKRDMAYNLEHDINELRGTTPLLTSLKDKITVLIPTSPIYSHPSTHIIEETVAQTRKNLPDCEIIIMIDGVRAEQQERAEDYEEYKRRLLWKCNFEWTNVVPIVFEEHMHQVGMTRAALEYVKTPLLLFVEHDTPLVSDEPIDWEGITTPLLNGEAYIVRLHHEGQIPAEHMSLMLDSEPQQYGTIKAIRTTQWSQRPHVSTVAFYKRILKDHFSENAKTMVEDKMHGVVQNAYDENGMQGWYDYRVLIYVPDMSNLKRSYNLDGRGNEDKYGMVF